MFEQISGYIVQLLDSSIYLSIGRMDWLFECKHLLFHLTVSENVLRCYPEAAMCAVLTDFRISTFYTMTSAFIQLAASSHYSQARYPHTHNLTLTRFDWFAISKSKTKCECDECQWERKIDSIEHFYREVGWSPPNAIVTNKWQMRETDTENFTFVTLR